MLPPPEGTVERWAWDYVLSVDLGSKLAPSDPPSIWEENPPPRRLNKPARPSALHVVARAPKAPRRNALAAVERRAELTHTFLHHELQAAELMAWALLAFPESPRAFRTGLANILLDEARHMRMYEGYLVEHGHRFGDFPVRDWFWERVPQAMTPVNFVAVMGMGLEAGNFDHAARYAEIFRAFGDERGAQIQEQVGIEEIAHVRFGVSWFTRWTQAGDFEVWQRHLPAPLSPMVMRGAPIAREARLRAGLSDAFVDTLTRWVPEERRAAR